MVSVDFYSFFSINFAKNYILRISSHRFNRQSFYTNKVLQLCYQNGHSNKVRRLTTTAQPSGTTLVVSVKSSVKIFSSFEAFLENTNFTMYIPSFNAATKPFLCFKTQDTNKDKSPCK